MLNVQSTRRNSTALAMAFNADIRHLWELDGDGSAVACSFDRSHCYQNQISRETKWKFKDYQKVDSNRWETSNVQHRIKRKDSRTVGTYLLTLFSLIPGLHLRSWCVMISWLGRRKSEDSHDLEKVSRLMALRKYPMLRRGMVNFEECLFSPSAPSVRYKLQNIILRNAPRFRPLSKPTPLLRLL